MRALQTASDSSIRVASAYYSLTHFTINVNLTDGNTHRIGLYLLGWATNSRAETISILDAKNQAVPDTETFSGLHSGQYAVWDIQGNVLIRVSNLVGGKDAVVSGLFFDTTSSVIPPIRSRLT